jgi:hypothetical protein
MTNRTDDPEATEATMEALELVDGMCGPVSFGDMLSSCKTKSIGAA